MEEEIHAHTRRRFGETGQDVPPRLDMVKGCWGALTSDNVRAQLQALARALKGSYSHTQAPTQLLNHTNAASGRAKRQHGAASQEYKRRCARWLPTCWAAPACICQQTVNSHTNFTHITACNLVRSLLLLRSSCNHTPPSDLEIAVVCHTCTVV